MALEAGPVVTEAEDKQGQKARYKFCTGQGRPLTQVQHVQVEERGACKNCTQMVLGKSDCLQHAVRVHPPHWGSLNWTSLIKPKASCPTL